MTGSGETEPEDITVRPIGRVESPLRRRDDAPRQGDEGAPAARLVLHADVAAGLQGIDVGAALVVITWLDRAARDTLTVHPRGDPERPLTGVFATRAPDRPNPVGLHDVTVEAVDGTTLTVSPLEALDGTPIVDLKPRR